MDACKPGDRVSVVGIYKAVPPRANGTTSGQFRAVLVANNVKRMVRDAGVPICEVSFLTANLHTIPCMPAWMPSTRLVIVLHVSGSRGDAYGMRCQPLDNLSVLQWSAVDDGRSSCYMTECDVASCMRSLGSHYGTGHPERGAAGR